MNALTWPFFNFEPALGTFCTFHGQSAMCLDYVQGEAQGEEEEAGVAGSSGQDPGRWHAAGDLHLRNDEGRERDVGCQGRAVGVDKGFDLLGFFIAGLNLQSFWVMIDRNDQDHYFGFNAEVSKYVTLWDGHMHADFLKYVQNCYWLFVRYLGNCIQFFFVK